MSNHAHDRNANTDMSGADIDAFDAMLNELSLPTGLPSSLPEERTTASATALASVASAFHESVAAAHDQRAGAAQPDSRLWEKIMHINSKSASGAATVPGISWSDSVVPAIRVEPRRRLPIWSIAFNVALVLTILFGAWGYWANRSDGGGNSDDDESIISPASATPAQAANTCDLSKGYFGYFGVTSSIPGGNRPSIWINEKHQLMVNCDAVPNGVVVAEEVIDLFSVQGSASWIGVRLELGDDDQQRIGLVRISDFTLVEVGVLPGESSYGYHLSPDSPWLVARSVENPYDLTVTDLRTLASRRISEIVGVEIKNGDTTSVELKGETLAVAIARSHGNGQIVVISGSLDASSVWDLPIPATKVSGISISPNGTKLALQTRAGDSSDEFTILEAATGKVIATSSPTIGASPSITWVADESGIAIVTTSTLSLLDGERETTLLEAQPYGELSALQVTHDPNVMIVHESVSYADATATPAVHRGQVHLVNLVTGQINSLPGYDKSIMNYPLDKPDRFLVMSLEYPVTGSIVDYQVVDSVTGEVVGEINDVKTPSRSRGFGPAFVGRSADGSVEVIAFDSLNIYLIRSDGETTTVTKMVPPDSELAASGQPVRVGLAADGTELTISINTSSNSQGEMWTISLVGDFGPWELVPE